MPRPSWAEYFMTITKEVASRSTCIRRHVGAILVKDKRILSTGYNGAPAGLRHCGEVGCLRENSSIPSGQRHELCRGLHAEQNVIIQAAFHGIPILGSTLYCKNKPCVICSNPWNRDFLFCIPSKQGFIHKLHPIVGCLS